MMNEKIEQMLVEHDDHLMMVMTNIIETLPNVETVFPHSNTIKVTGTDLDNLQNVVDCIPVLEMKVGNIKNRPDLRMVFFKPLLVDTVLRLEGGIKG